MRTILLLLVVLWSIPALAQDRVCYTRPDGGISIAAPAQGVSLAEVMANSVPPDASNVRPCDSSTFPPDRAFRNAWRQNGSQVEIDMPAARQIQMERLERARREEMRELSLREDLGENVAGQKAAVRAIDPPGLVNAVQTPGQLKGICPAPLAERLGC